MIKNYLRLLLLFLFSKTYAQVIIIPDANFKAKLLSSSTSSDVAYNFSSGAIKIDANNNGEIEAAEALKVDMLYIYNSNILDYTGIEKFSNLKILECNNNPAVSIDITDLVSLQRFNCKDNKLTKLNAKNCKSLTDFTFDNNPIVDLNLSGCSSLQFLNCFTSTIATLNLEGCISMSTLNCPSNQLTSLDLSSLSMLVNLQCSNNKLKTLNVNGAKKIAWIYCDNNELTTLDVSTQTNMNELHCKGNKLTELDVSMLPNFLRLDCSQNQINVLKVAKKIDVLYCSNNQLTEIDLTNSNIIRYLDVSFNKLITIDGNALNNLESFKCSNNNLQSLFLKNGKYNYFLDFSNNPNITYICSDEMEYESTYFQSLIDKYGYVNCALNSFCEFGPGGNNYKIKGKITYDSDKNGCDQNDKLASTVKFSIADGAKSSTVFSNADGNYTAYFKEGTYTLTPNLENPSFYKISPESVKVTFNKQNDTFLQDFCITPIGSLHDLEITIIPTTVARPGFDASYNIVYRNKGNQARSGTVTFDFNDAVLDYISSVPSVSSQATNKLIWNYSSLQPFESRVITLNLNVNSPMETPPVNNNDRLSFNALILPVTDDEKPVDNSFAMRQVVVGSYDPNDKTCLEGDIVKPELIGEYVHYLIRFENTGTYLAENVMVRDMIDLSKFDISTLTPIESSHSYITKITNGNKVEFVFEKINLPFDDANNDGYIAFKIKTLPTLTVGDSFSNEANIYFDYNFPIITNKATSVFKTVLGTQDFVFKDYFKIYPNPVHDFLYIDSSDNIEKQAINIYNMLGQLVLTIPNAFDVTTIDVSKFSSGTYFLQIKSLKGTVSQKFIKL